MEMQAVEAARRWLADQGVSQAHGGWVSDAKPEVLLTANQVAHSWAGDVFTEDLDTTDQLRLAFGLLDLLDEYWVTCEIRFANEGVEGPLPADVLWDGYRRRLEAARDVEAVTYSLWVDWFEDHTTSAVAFAKVLGNDIDRVVVERSETLLRRARRVLEYSGPVRWAVKEPTYCTAVRLPAMHSAVFRGLRASFHDVYGDLEPAAALALLDRLDLSPHEHPVPCRTAPRTCRRAREPLPQPWCMGHRGSLLLLSDGPCRPTNGASDVESGQADSRCPFIARGDPTQLLQVVDAPPDGVAPLVRLAFKAGGGLPEPPQPRRRARFVGAKILEARPKVAA
ncbi:hypothetical protein [Streptomyces chartreusis]|uniref:hypothetical protein n=1 Tax=Streptomyces chartreusis TaxID=1969 RepID=UPI0037FDD59B